MGRKEPYSIELKRIELDQKIIESERAKKAYLNYRKRLNTKALSNLMGTIRNIEKQQVKLNDQLNRYIIKIDRLINGAE